VQENLTVVTLCRKRGFVTQGGENLPFCRAYSNRPNPQDQRSYVTGDRDTEK
jgi:hypothetical protein